MEQKKHLTIPQVDVLAALIERGPLDDGDIPSKQARTELLELGLVAKVIVKGEDGFNAATYLGRDAFSEHYGCDTMRDALNKRRNAGGMFSLKIPTAADFKSPDFPGLPE